MCTRGTEVLGNARLAQLRGENVRGAQYCRECFGVKMQTLTSRLICQIVWLLYAQERTLSSWQSSTNNPMQLLSSYEKKEGVQIFLCKTAVCWLHGSKAKPHVSSLKTYGSSSISEAAQVRLDFLQKKKVRLDTLIRWTNALTRMSVFQQSFIPYYLPIFFTCKQVLPG